VVPYQSKDHEFDVHYRPLWDWALDLLNDEQLVSHFEWDAQKLFKFNGTDYIRFFNEPWTGNRWWEVQVCCHLILCYIFMPANATFCCSQSFLKVESHSALFYMQIRQSCPPLGLRKDIL
jgi:hypothetical protein